MIQRAKLNAAAVRRCAVIAQVQDHKRFVAPLTKLIKAAHRPFQQGAVGRISSEEEASRRSFEDGSNVSRGSSPCPSHSKLAI